MNTFKFLLKIIYLVFIYSHRIQYTSFIQLNQTHFKCDEGKNILELSKVNDDYCDCADGTDESSRHK